MLYTWKWDSPVCGKALRNKKLWSSTEGPEQPYKAKVSLDKAQMCSKSCTHSAHSWEKPRVCLCGILLFRVTGRAQGKWTVLCWDWTNTATHIYTHVHSNPGKLTSSSSDLRPWLRMQAAQISADMPQKHIAMKRFCEETTVGADCTWTVKKA